MPITLKALQYFTTAVERGSIARAAEDLNVVPSAVSAAIDQVEEAFALKLVQRYPSRGIAVTATGQILLGKVRHLLEEYQNLMSEGVELRTSLTGTLRVGYYAPVAPAFLPAIAAPLLAGNPSVSVNFHECDNEAAQTGLLDGAFDVILFVAENVRPGIAYETLLSVPPYALVSAEHRLAGRASIGLGDLRDEPLVLLDRPAVRDYYSGLLEQIGQTPRISATGTTHEMVRSLVGAGIGCAVLNMRPAVNVSYAGDRVIALPVVSDVKPLQLVLGHLQENPRRLVRAFIAGCQDYFATEAARRLMVCA